MAPFSPGEITSAAGSIASGTCQTDDAARNVRLPGQSNRAPHINESGAIVEPGFLAAYRLYVHCGIEWLGSVNNIAWRADVPGGVQDFVPPAWEPAVRDESIDLSILLHTDPEPVIEATANGHTVVYRATAEDLPGCD